MKKIVSLLLLVAVLSVFPSFVFATSTVSSSGSLSAHWNQNSGVFLWSTSGGESPIYSMNGADAIWGTENYTLSGDNRIYDQHESNYDSPGWVETLEDVIDESTANFGSAVLGQAATTIASVSSSGDVTNDATGVILNASGTSHLVRDFTIAETGDFSFDASYLFTNSAALDDSAIEWVDWYHHANIILGYHLDDGSWAKLDEAIIAYGMSSPLSLDGMLSVSDVNGWITGRQYSIELHTYNSASAYSPQQQTPVPEPTTILLLGSGLFGLGWYGRKRKKA